MDMKEITLNGVYYKFSFFLEEKMRMYVSTQDSNASEKKNQL